MRSARDRYQSRTAPRLLTAERQVACERSSSNNSSHGLRRVWNPAAHEALGFTGLICRVKPDDAVFSMLGAMDGPQTDATCQVATLGSCRSTIELHPQHPEV